MKCFNNCNPLNNINIEITDYMINIKYKGKDIIKIRDNAIANI